MKPSPVKPAAVDWERIAVMYRAGVMSVREIASECGVSHTAINKRASKEGWVRDLNAKIKAEADAKVSRALVSKEVSAETKLTEKLTVEVEATVQARIRLTHRSDIASARTLAMSLLAELEHQTANGEDYERLGEMVIASATDEGSSPQRTQKLTEAFERALSLSGRVKTMKDLADTLRILIDKEREAFSIGLDKDVPPSDPAETVAAFIGQLHQSGAGRLQFSPPRGTAR